MERMVRMALLMVVVVTLAVGLLDRSQSSAAAAKPKNCFLLLYNECFKNFDFKPDEKKWSKRAIVMSSDTFEYLGYDIVLGSDTTLGDIKYGNWFRWQKSFFMHQLCSSYAPPGICKSEPGLPVYGGSLSGTTGQGFMTKTTGTFEWPICWSIKPITKGNEKYCLPLDLLETSEVSQRTEEDEDNDLEISQADEEAERWFKEMRGPWLRNNPAPHE